MHVLAHRPVNDPSAIVSPILFVNEQPFMLDAATVDLRDPSDRNTLEDLGVIQTTIDDKYRAIGMDRQIECDRLALDAFDLTGFLMQRAMLDGWVAETYREMIAPPADTLVAS